MYSASDWQRVISELLEIYGSEPEVEARHLSQHRHFIVTGNPSQPFACIHAVYLGLRGEDMRGRDGKTQNIRTITASIARHGYRRIERNAEEFEQIWPHYDAECSRSGRPPSGATKKGPRDRSFFALGALPWSVELTAATPDDLQELARFQGQIAASLASSSQQRRARLALASKQPRSVLRKTVAYLRNPDVVAERLFLANGICDACQKTAPFIRAKENTPYLEVHHIIPLSENGLDTVANTQALCPNCHRQAHYG